MQPGRPIQVAGRIHQARQHSDSWRPGCLFERAEKLRRLANHHIVAMGTMIPFPAMHAFLINISSIHHVARCSNSSDDHPCRGDIVPHAYINRTSRPRALSNSAFSTSSLRMLSDTELLRTADIPDGAKAVAEAARARKRVADSIFILVVYANCRLWCLVSGNSGGG